MVHGGQVRSLGGWGTLGLGQQFALITFEIDEPVEAEFFNALTKRPCNDNPSCSWMVGQPEGGEGGQKRASKLAKQFVQGEWALSGPGLARVGLTRLPVLFAAEISIEWTAASIALGDQ